MISFEHMVLRTDKLDATLNFYHALGLEFVHEQHGSGPIHYSTDIDGILLEIYPAETDSVPDQSGATMLGFTVESLDEILTVLRELGIEPTSPPKNSAWGRRAVVLDPDGRAIDLNELT